MSVPDINSVQNDIGFANNYRIELIKQGLVFSVGIFAFTISAFLLSSRQMPQETLWMVLLYVGWAALIVSTACGLYHLYCWEAFYISYRDYDYKAGKMSDETEKAERLAKGNAYRTCLNWKRRKVRAGQFGGLILGSILIAAFTGKVLLL